MSFDMAVVLNVPTNVSTATTVLTTAGFPITLPPGALGIKVTGHVTITLGAGATAVRLEFSRPGNPNFGVLTITGLTAGNTYSFMWEGLDSSTQAYANASYGLIVTQQGAPTGAGNVIRGSISVDAVVP